MLAYPALKQQKCVAEPQAVYNIVYLTSFAFEGSLEAAQGKQRFCRTPDENHWSQRGERVRTSKIRMSKVKKLIKNLKKIRTSKVFFKLIKTSKVTIIISLIRTSKIKTTKMEVDQNVESDNNHQLDQNVKNQNVKKNVEIQKLSKKTFNVLIFFDAIGKIRTSKVFWAIPMGYYLCIPRPVWG